MHPRHWLSTIIVRLFVPRLIRKIELTNFFTEASTAPNPPQPKETTAAAPWRIMEKAPAPQPKEENTEQELGEVDMAIDDD